MTLSLFFLSWVRILHTLTLSHGIDTHTLVVYTNGSVPFGKVGSSVLTNCPFRGDEATLFYSKSLVMQAFLRKTAPFCTLSFSLCYTKSSTSPTLRLLLCFYYTFLRPSIYLTIPGTSDRNNPLFLLFIGLQWIPGRSFFLGNGAADALAEQGTLLQLSSPMSLLFTHILDWRGTVLFKFFDTHIPSAFTEELVLPRMPIVSSLIFAATDSALCYTLSSLNLRVLYAALAVIRHRTLFISFCTVLLWTLGAVCSLVTFLHTISGPGLVKLLVFWGSMVF